LARECREQLEPALRKLFKALRKQNRRGGRAGL
jgi:hypothetical protein